eukprot:TRINITY_DN10704_c0_g1_i1.p1 TRINITY_DN10704_c0_g1~~TRINITY_DN10704_c0_g1_i1.p1  ORF type:complete len:189 (+),score=28.86 TRINITY_DN10704_c0_g1_i1:212-778(+)
MDSMQDNDQYSIQTEVGCAICHTTNTPMWRKGPLGKNTLCNKCGIKWSRVQNPRKKLKPSRRAEINIEYDLRGSSSSNGSDSNPELPLAPSSPIMEDESYSEKKKRKSRDRKSNSDGQKKMKKNNESLRDENIPSVFDLLHKLRDSKVLVDVVLPEKPLDGRHKRFFTHAALELQRLEDSIRCRSLYT